MLGHRLTIAVPLADRLIHLALQQRQLSFGLAQHVRPGLGCGNLMLALTHRRPASITLHAPLRHIDAGFTGAFPFRGMPQRAGRRGLGLATLLNRQSV